LAALGFIAEPLALRALTIGAIGGLTVGMTLYAIRYWPALARARIDGRPG
jgi:uncharacterized protein involved in response to NO